MKNLREDLAGHNENLRHVFSFDITCLVVGGYPKEVNIYVKREGHIRHLPLHPSGNL